MGERFGLIALFSFNSRGMAPKFFWVHGLLGVAPYFFTFAAAAGFLGAAGADFFAAGVLKGFFGAGGFFAAAAGAFLTVVFGFAAGLFEWAFPVLLAGAAFVTLLDTAPGFAGFTGAFEVAEAFAGAFFLPLAATLLGASFCVDAGFRTGGVNEAMLRMRTSDMGRKSTGFTAFPCSRIS